MTSCRQQSAHIRNLSLNDSWRLTPVQVQIGEVERVEWRITRYEDMTITQGTGLLFEWDGVISHNLIEMASPLSTSRDCTFVGTRGNEVGQVSPSRISLAIVGGG